jgi:hypothetical protein
MEDLMKLPFVKINLVKSGPANVCRFFPVQCVREALKSLHYLTKNRIALFINTIRAECGEGTVPGSLPFDVSTH